MTVKFSGFKLTLSTKKLSDDHVFGVSEIEPLSHLEQVRADMRVLVHSYFRRHVERIDAVAEAKEFNRVQRKRRKDGLSAEETRELPPPLPPLLINTTVGTGKSVLVRMLAELSQQHSLPLAVCAPTHQLVDEHCAAAEGMGHYYGRTDPATTDKPENVCWKLDETARAGDQNHRVAAALCTKCENGQAGALKHGGAEAKAAAVQWFEARKINPAKIKPCRFLYEGLPQALAQPRLALPTAAFSEAIGLHMHQDSMETTQRLVVVDETTELTQEVRIGVAAIHDWIDNIDALAEKIGKTKTDGDDDGTSQALAELLPEIRKVFEDLIVSIAKKEEIDGAKIIALQKSVSKAKGSKGGTARWEHITRTNEGYNMPLRALNTLAANLKTGALRRGASAIYIYEIKPILGWAIEHGSVILLDATASQGVKQIVESLSGEVFNRQVQQNMVVSMVSGHLYARGKVPLAGNPDPRVGKSFTRAAKSYINEIVEIANQLPEGNGRAVITHKAYLKFAGKTADDDGIDDLQRDFMRRAESFIGWYGKHDRGHNLWSGCNIALVGMPILSSASIAAAFAGHRAGMIEAGIELPAWDGVMSDEEERQAQGGVPLPLQSEVRGWLLDQYAATTAQSVGRARAVNSKTEIVVQIWGGLQCPEFIAALSVHGIQIDKVIPNTIHPRRAQTDQEAVGAAISMLEGVRVAVSKRNVLGALKSLSIKMDEHKVEAELARLRAGGLIPPASKGGRTRK